MTAMHRIAIALGSNLGERRANLEAAAGRLAAAGLRELRLSSFLATVPCDCREGAGEFLNAAMTARTAMSPVALLQVCQQVEVDLGRRRGTSGPPYEDRLIDVDLLLYDQVVLVSERLILPHPQLRRRRFVLAPLAEIAGDWTLPPDGVTVAESLARLMDEGDD